MHSCVAMRPFIALVIGAHLGVSVPRSESGVAPSVWASATSWGGTRTESADGLAVDPDGNLFIVGRTTSPDFHPSVSLPPSVSGGLTSAWFLQKLDRRGTLLSTTRVSAEYGFAMHVAVDREGFPHVAFHRPNVTDVIKFDPTGARRLYEVAFAGIGEPERLTRAIAVDEDGHAIIAGVTGRRSVFVIKLDREGRVMYETVLPGGNRGAEVRDAVADIRGNVYVTGDTASPDFPTTSPLQPRYGGGLCVPLGHQPFPFPCRDAFLIKLDRDGQLVYSTYLGGTGNDAGVVVAVDRRGAAFVVGTTESRDFPIVNAVQPTCRPGFIITRCGDTFVAKVDPTGTSLVFSTFLGATGPERCCGVAVDANGSAYVLGGTSGTDLPVYRAAQARHAGSGDIFVVTLTADGRLLWSTYFGGSGEESPGHIALAGRAAYVVGTTSSPGWPGSGGGGVAGEPDLFLAWLWDPRGR